MNNQLTYKEVIANAPEHLTIVRNGKKITVTNTRQANAEMVFNTVKALGAYVNDEVNSYNAQEEQEEPEEQIQEVTKMHTQTYSDNKQGSDAVRINPDKIVLVTAQFQAKTPASRRNAEVTAKLKESEGDNFEAITKLMCDSDGRVYPEIKAVTALRNAFRNALAKLSIDFSFRGQSAISVHNMAKVKEIKDKFACELADLQADIISKLPTWRQEYLANNPMANENDFPTEDYFANYKIILGFSRLEKETETYDASEILEDIHDSAREQIAGRILAIKERLESVINPDNPNGRATSLPQARVIEGIRDDIIQLQESEIFEGQGFENTCKAMLEILNRFSVEGIKAARKAIDKGVIDPAQHTGKRGKAPKAVTQEDIDKEEKFIQSQVDDIEDLTHLVNNL